MSDELAEIKAKLEESKELNAQLLNVLSEQIVPLLSDIREAVGNPQKVDLLDAATQLRNRNVNLKLREFLLWENRFLKDLDERARRGARDTYDFVDQYMRDAIYLEDQFTAIGQRAEEIGKPGQNILDLGVYKGGSTRALARIFSDHTIHGFDSFEGLPGDWSHAPKGTFGDVNGILPDMPENVDLYKGWFSETLPEWRKIHTDPICLLRVDCDIYSSTVDIFNAVGDLLQPGSWICFDELIGYYGWQDHEYRAAMEFLEDKPYKLKYVAYGLTYTLAQLVEK